MLNIDIEDRNMRLYIPRNGRALGAVSALSLVNTVENTAPALVVPVIEAWEEGRYALLVVSLPEGLHKGEWRYEFTTDGELVSTGLVTVTGEGEPAYIAYDEGKTQEYHEYGE